MIRPPPPRAILAAALLAAVLIAGLALRPARPPSAAKEPPMTAAATPSAAPQTDAAQLARLIALPGPPQAVRFDVSGTGDQVLCALLEYAPGTAAAVLQGAPITRPAGGVLNISASDWLVAALAGAIAPRADGMQEVTAPLHDPAPFARSPFLNGWAFDAGGGRVALCLFSM